MANLLTALDLEALAAVAGLSMAEVCRRAGIAQSTFTRWKTGKTEPTLDVYRKLCEAVSPTNPSSLVSGRIPMNDEMFPPRALGMAEHAAPFVFESARAENQTADADEREAVAILSRIDRDFAVEDARADRLLQLYRR